MVLGGAPLGSTPIAGGSSRGRKAEDGSIRVPEDASVRDTEDGGYLTSEDGAYILTEDGGRIALEASEHSKSDLVGSVSSTSWTGLPKEGILSEQALVRLKQALQVIDDAIEKSGCSNEERATARAYALAIHALAEAPDPPADLIWTLVKRAGALAGIASLFVTLIELYK